MRGSCFARPGTTVVIATQEYNIHLWSGSFLKLTWITEYSTRLLTPSLKPPPDHGCHCRVDPRTVSFTPKREGDRKCHQPQVQFPPLLLVAIGDQSLVERSYHRASSKN